MLNMPQQAQALGDISSIGILGLVWAEMLPTVASIITIVWLSLQSYILIRDKIINYKKKDK